jgi:hypothetical protein
MSKLYTKWIESKIRNKYKGMHQRAKNSGGRISVCSEWSPSLDPNAYQNFRTWMLSQKWRDEEYGILELDKDKYSKDEYYKEYSPETCCFITKDENVALSGWFGYQSTLV